MNIDINNPEQVATALQMMSEQINQLQLSLSQQPTFQNHSKEPKVATPDKFNGNQRQLRNFISSANNVFRLQQSRFPTDRVKVYYIGTLLTGNALTWFRTLDEHNSVLFDDMNDFLDEFKSTFGDRDAKHNAQRKLCTLRQGSSSVLTYATTFLQVALDTGFNDEAKKAIFYAGLNEEVKDAIAWSDEAPDDLTRFIQFCIRADNRLFERRMERNKQRSTMNRPTTFRPVAQTSAPHQSTPMEIDSIRKFGPLTAEEKERRRKHGLCLYCGTPGHQSFNCPNKRKPSTQVRSMETKPETDSKNVQDQ